MNTFEFNAFITRFPALEIALQTKHATCQREWVAIRDPSNCEGIFVETFNEYFLADTPTHNSHSGSMVSINRKETIYLVLTDGSVVADAVRQRGDHGSNYAHEGTHHSPGETVLEAIVRQGLTDRVHSAIKVQSGFRVEDHHSTPAYSATVYVARYAATAVAVIDHTLIATRLAAQAMVDAL